MISSSIPASSGSIQDVFHSAPDSGWLPAVTVDDDVISFVADTNTTGSEVFVVKLVVEGFSLVTIKLLDSNDDYIDTREVNIYFGLKSTFYVSRHCAFKICL